MQKFWRILLHNSLDDRELADTANILPSVTEGVTVFLSHAHVFLLSAVLVCPVAVV